MWSASLYLKDPAGSRFVAGGPAEAELLLGSPLPALPPPDRDGGRNVFAVRFHPQLRTLLLRFLQGLLSQIGAEGVGPPRPRRPRPAPRPGRVRGGAGAPAAVGARGRPAARPAEPVLAGPHPRRGRVAARAGG